MSALVCRLIAQAFVLSACLIASPLALSAGSAGPVSIPGFYAAGSLPLADGQSLVSGGMRTAALGYHFALARVASDGTLDTTFGEGGVARAPVWGDYEFANQIALQPDGRILVGGLAGDPARPAECAYLDCGAPFAIVRFLQDGAVDPTFNGGQPVILRIGRLDPLHPAAEEGVRVDGISVAPSGMIYLYTLDPAGCSYCDIELVALTPDGSLDLGYISPSPVAQVDYVPVIEYYHAGLDHYFVTADRAEFTALDRGAFGSWKRTRVSFHAWPAGTAGHSPVCRLHANPAYGTVTHFLTPADSPEFAHGCDDLLDPKYGDAWLLESRDVFRVDVPDALTGTCPPGGVPVYRLWNRRADTNHRYTSSSALRTIMVATEGYVAEGFGADRVILCAAP